MIASFWRAGGLCALVLLALASLWNSQQASPTRDSPRGGAVAPVDWPHFGNSADQTRYSPLTRINARTVRRLGLAWTLPEGPNLATFETDPVVVDGVMYYTTNTDQVEAVHADTGRVLWRYTPVVSFLQLLAGGAGDQPANRGVEVADGRVYLLTFDDQLIALDTEHGHKLWSVTVADAHAGYTEQSPPTYWRGMLFVGSAEGDAGLRGFIAAYDAGTGKQIWRFYTVPAPGRSWMPARDHHGGGDVWMPVTVDSTTGILYAGTGNPSPDLVNRDRPGCNPWVDATLALDARSGRLLWGRTQVCPDVWDYDSAQTPLLFSVRSHGRLVRAVGQGSKSGSYWIFDAAHGATLARSPVLGMQTARRPVPTRQGVLVCPGKLGSLEYSPPAYDPSLRTIYLPGLNLCTVYKSASLREIDAHTPGAPDLGGTADQVRGRPSGFMAALDADTGKVRWLTRVHGPMIGGALVTAGNLVFSGADDGHLYAFDARNGAILWRADLGLGFGAAPISYAIGGTQYIAIAAGGSGVAALTGARIGGTLVVFKLDGKPVHRLQGFPSS